VKSGEVARAAFAGLAGRNGLGRNSGPACHAGGRRFESDRSRFKRCWLERFFAAPLQALIGDGYHEQVPNTGVPGAESRRLDGPQPTRPPGGVVSQEAVRPYVTAERRSLCPDTVLGRAARRSTPSSFGRTQQQWAEREGTMPPTRTPKAARPSPLERRGSRRPSNDHPFTGRRGAEAGSGGRVRLVTREVGGTDPRCPLVEHKTIQPVATAPAARTTSRHFNIRPAVRLPRGRVDDPRHSAGAQLDCLRARTIVTQRGWANSRSRLDPGPDEQG
jgi:hypothetical protein